MSVIDAGNTLLGKGWMSGSRLLCEIVAGQPILKINLYLT